MSRCHVCGSIESKEEYPNEVFQIDNKPVLVERIRCMVLGEAKPVKSVLMKVFTFA